MVVVVIVVVLLFWMYDNKWNSHIIVNLNHNFLLMNKLKNFVFSISIQE